MVGYGPDGHRRSQVGRDLQPFKSFDNSILDEGTNSPGLLIEFDSDVGEDRFQIDFRVYTSDIWNEWYYWVVTTEELTYKIDNPLLGYPDVKKPGQYGDGWPPRYDAKFYTRRNGNWEKQGDNKNLQGRIFVDGSWKVF